MAILWASKSPSAATQFRETEIAAHAVGLQLQSLEVRNPDDLEAAFQSARKVVQRPLWYRRLVSLVFTVHESRILDPKHGCRLCIQVRFLLLRVV